MVAGVLLKSSSPIGCGRRHGIRCDRNPYYARDHLDWRTGNALEVAPDPLGLRLAAAALDRVAFETTWGFDERIFGYCEDPDLASANAYGRLFLPPAASAA